MLNLAQVCFHFSCQICVHLFFFTEMALSSLLKMQKEHCWQRMARVGTLEEKQINEPLMFWRMLVEPVMVFQGKYRDSTGIQLCSRQFYSPLWSVMCQQLLTFRRLFVSGHRCHPSLGEGDIIVQNCCSSWLIHESGLSWKWLEIARSLLMVSLWGLCCMLPPKYLPRPVKWFLHLTE